MGTNKANILLPIVEFVTVAALMVAVPFIVSLDIEEFLYGNSEISFTELTQEALVLLTTVIFGTGAIKQPASRNWLVLVTGFFACMFIREFDYWLNRIVDGLWTVLAGLVAVSAVFYSLRRRKNLMEVMAAHAKKRSHGYITAGLVIVVLFSRLFGASEFWLQVMGDNYHAAYKTVIQEGLELLGYTLIAFGSLVFYCESRADSSGS